MKVKEIMSKEIKFVEPKTCLPEIAKLMRDEDIGVLPVEDLDKDRIVGVVTDRDLVIRGLTNCKDAGEKTAEEVMTPNCLYCFEEDTVEEVCENMSKNQVRRLPVLNKDKRLVGIVSLGDLATKGCDHEAEEALHAICEVTH